MNEINKNSIVLIGNIVGEKEFDHEVYDEKFYILQIETKRKSDTVDILPILVSEKLLPIVDLDHKIKVTGQLRTYNMYCEEEKRSKLRVIPFIFELENIMDEDMKDIHNTNEVSIIGFICKEPNRRETPKKRVICDLTIASNRAFDKSDYIPSIAWGRNAIFASSLVVGDAVSVVGRLQSRNYNKQLDDGEVEIRTAYELSINKISLLEPEDKEDIAE